jgi:hypothetical protein
MNSNCKIIVVLSLLFAMVAPGLVNAQTSSKLNTPALMEQYRPFADYPEGYQAVGLTDILYRSCPARDLEQPINVYWKAVKAASDWKFFRQRVEKINRFDPQNNAVVKLFLQKTEDKAAMAHLKMRRFAIELNAMAGDCGFSPGSLPYCNELPHFGDYHTNIDKIAQVRSVSGEMRMLAKRIDLGYEQIKASAAALAAAIYYLEAQTELYRAGNSTITDVINAFEQEESTRETFWKAILSYNQDIARYVVWTQAGQTYNPKQLAPLLLLNPRPATVFETTQNNAPNSKSLLDQRPDTYGNSNSGSTPDPTYPADVNPSGAAPQPDTQLQPSDPNINPLPTEPSYTPIIQNDSLRTPKIYQVAYTPSGELTTPNWFDVSVYKPAGTIAVTLKEYLSSFSPMYYQQATNQYWRASAQCQKLAVIITARRRAEEVQQKVFARLSDQGNSAQSSLFLLAMNVWKQTLAAEAIETQKAILKEQFGLNQLLSMAGAYSSQELWPITPFHTESYQVIENVPGLENDLAVKPLAGSINQEFSLMNQTRSALEQASAVVERDAASNSASFKDVITELQTEFYFATAFVNQTAEYNFSIGNYVQRWMYARKSPLSLDDFCQSIVSRMR